jgi:hypothetical protein
VGVVVLAPELKGAVLLVAEAGTMAAPKDNSVLKHSTIANVRFSIFLINNSSLCIQALCRKNGSFSLKTATPFTMQSISFHYTFSHYAEQPLK